MRTFAWIVVIASIFAAITARGRTHGAFLESRGQRYKVGTGKRFDLTPARAREIMRRESAHLVYPS